MHKCTEHYRAPHNHVPVLLLAGNVSQSSEADHSHKAEKVNGTLGYPGAVTRKTQTVPSHHGRDVLNCTKVVKLKEKDATVFIAF